MICSHDSFASRHCYSDIVGELCRKLRTKLNWNRHFEQIDTDQGIVDNEI